MKVMNPWFNLLYIPIMLLSSFLTIFNSNKLILQMSNSGVLYKAITFIILIISISSFKIVLNNITINYKLTSKLDHYVYIIGKLIISLVLSFAIFLVYKAFFPLDIVSVITSVILYPCIPLTKSLIKYDSKILNNKIKNNPISSLKIWKRIV